MRRILITLVAVLTASTLPSTVFAQFGAKSADAPAIAKRSLDQTVQLMLLGTYHFNNPGMDEMNAEVDDYFAEKRQQEIADVVAKLSKFKPTKIFVEASPRFQETLDQRYQAFAKGELDLKDLKNGRSETYQLGFRVAKACQLSGVHCIDAPGAWLGQKVNEASDELMPNFNAEVRGEMMRLFEKESERLLTSTIGENLIKMNTRESIMRNHSYYNQISALVADPSKPAGIKYGTQDFEGEEYQMIGVEERHIGAELVGKWYTRNIKIFSNLIRSIDGDDERVLVIFGQGHIRPIQHFCEDHPTLELVHPNDFLKAEK